MSTLKVEGLKLEVVTDKYSLPESENFNNCKPEDNKWVHEFIDDFILFAKDIKQNQDDDDYYYDKRITIIENRLLELLNQLGYSASLYKLHEMNRFAVSHQFDREISSIKEWLFHNLIMIEWREYSQATFDLSSKLTLKPAVLSAQVSKQIPKFNLCKTFVLLSNQKISMDNLITRCKFWCQIKNELLTPLILVDFIVSEIKKCNVQEESGDTEVLSVSKLLKEGVDNNEVANLVFKMLLKRGILRIYNNTVQNNFFHDNRDEQDFKFEVSLDVNKSSNANLLKWFDYGYMHNSSNEYGRILVKVASEKDYRLLSNLLGFRDFKSYFDELKLFNVMNEPSKIQIVKNDGGEEWSLSVEKYVLTKAKGEDLSSANQNNSQLFCQETVEVVGPDALRKAVREGNVNIVEELLNSIGYSNQDYSNALLVAVFCGRAAVVELLIDKGATVDKKNLDEKKNDYPARKYAAIKKIIEKVDQIDSMSDDFFSKHGFNGFEIQMVNKLKLHTNADYKARIRTLFKEKHTEKLTALQDFHKQKYEMRTWLFVLECIFFPIVLMRFITSIVAYISKYFDNASFAQIFFMTDTEVAVRQEIKRLTPQPRWNE